MEDTSKTQPNAQTEQGQPQAQPIPQPQPAMVQNQVQVPATIPGIQNVVNYIAIGPAGQLYAYDINLGAWGVANSSHMESVLMSCGIPGSALQAVKNFVHR